MNHLQGVTMKIWLSNEQFGQWEISSETAFLVAEAQVMMKRIEGVFGSMDLEFFSCSTRTNISFVGDKRAKKRVSVVGSIPSRA